MKKFLLLTIALLLCSVSGLAQEFRATVSGRVADPAGAAVANATITVRNTSTNETATVTTGSEGSYKVP